MNRQTSSHLAVAPHTSHFLSSSPICHSQIDSQWDTESLLHGLALVTKTDKTLTRDVQTEWSEGANREKQLAWALLNNHGNHLGYTAGVSPWVALQTHDWLTLNQLTWSDTCWTAAQPPLSHLLHVCWRHRSETCRQSEFRQVKIWEKRGSQSDGGQCYLLLATFDCRIVLRIVAKQWCRFRRTWSGANLRGRLAGSRRAVVVLVSGLFCAQAKKPENNKQFLSADGT